jgi:uncharacterized protein (UPF0332 family)
VADFDPAANLYVAEYMLRGLSGARTSASDRDQALVRASISRSYYAAFLTAREQCAALGLVTLTAGPRDHWLVVNALAGRLRQAADKLDRLRDKRNQADYNLSPRGFTLTAAQYWLAIAREIIDEVSRLT